MEILLTGNTCFVTKAWVEMAFPEDHVLITCGRGQPHPPKLRAITLDSKERIGQLVDSYEFDRIVYFSEYLTPHSEQEGELDRLRRVLQANRDRESQLLYLAGPEAVLTPAIGKTVVAQAAEALCRHYAETSKVQIKVLHLPYLYGCDGTGAPAGIAGLLTRMRDGELHFDEQALAPVFALCMKDLSELVLRVFDNWTPEWESFTAPVVFALNYEQLGEAWKALHPGLKITYGTDLIRTYPPDDGVLRCRYGWFPRYSLEEDLPRLFRTETHARHSRTWGQRLGGLRERHRHLLEAAEIVASFGFTELLVQLTGSQAQFRVVDFRLAFIVLAANVYGLNAGVAAALLASASLAVGYWEQGASPLLLFYEPSNWLAFLVYFVVGAVCGYVQLRSAENVRFAEEQCRLLEERLRFVRQLYQDIMEDKRSLRRQILGRRDSFGKVYAVTRALNETPPDKLPGKTVELLEDVLQNHSAAFYFVDAVGRTAKRAACSEGAEAPRFLEGPALAELVQTLEQEEVWVNRALTPGLPMFGAAVRVDGKLRALVLLYDGGGEQLSLHYQNLFRILCGLVETAMTRAAQPLPEKRPRRQEVRV